MSYTAPDLADDIHHRLTLKGYIIAGDVELPTPGCQDEGTYYWIHAEHGRGPARDDFNAAVMDALDHLLASRLAPAAAAPEPEPVPAETDEQRLEREFQEARAEWKQGGGIVALCKAIDAGYAAGHCMYDSDMIGLAEDLTNNTAAIETLADAARDALGTANDLIGGYDEPAYVRDHLEALTKALDAF